MSIPTGYQANYSTLLQAVRDGKVCLLQCTDQKTGAPVMVICAHPSRFPGYLVEWVPLAKLFDGDPYEEVTPPAEADLFTE